MPPQQAGKLKGGRKNSKSHAEAIPLTTQDSTSRINGPSSGLISSISSPDVICLHRIICGFKCLTQRGKLIPHIPASNACQAFTNDNPGSVNFKIRISYQFTGRRHRLSHNLRIVWPQVFDIVTLSRLRSCYIYRQIFRAPLLYTH